MAQISVQVGVQVWMPKSVQDQLSVSVRLLEQKGLRDSVANSYQAMAVYSQIIQEAVKLAREDVR